jgi:L-threonylcarbamoyladenylate synthase
MDTEVIPGSQPGALDRAAALLQQGEAVAFPTDTVYGLGASAFDARSIEKLYAIKDRDSQKAIAVLISRLDQLPQVAGEMGTIASRLAARFWPGPLTLVVPVRPGLPANLSPLPTVGVRMPDHPVARQLMDLTGPLAVTSANLSGASSTRTAQEVFDQLNGRIPLILDGGLTPGGSPSTVVDCTGPQPVILRLGPIGWDDLQSASDPENR